MAGLTPDFTRADFEELRAARRKLFDALGFLEKCEKCGMDMSAARLKREEIDAFLESVEREFMTPPPGHLQ